jgi:hypothetical protein
MTMSTPINAADYNQDFVPVVQPQVLTNGGIAVVTADVPVENDGTYAATWIVEGPVPLSDEDSRIALLGATSVTGGLVELSSPMTTIRATLDTGPLSVGAWTRTTTRAKARASRTSFPGSRSPSRSDSGRSPPATRSQ